MKRFSSLTGAFFFILISAFRLFSQAGALDPTFGVNGKVSIELDYYGVYATSLQVLPDGKFLVAGAVKKQPNAVGLYSSLVRLNPDGTIDSTFGINGLAPQYGPNVYNHLILVQPDGKILSMLNISVPLSDLYRFIIIRYNEDGTYDNTFGVNGKAGSPSGLNISAESITLAPDGKILIPGQVGSPANFNPSIMRFLPNGSKDTSFGTNGIVEFEYDGQYDYFSTLDIQPDGKIVAAGSAKEKMVVVRLDDAGSLDPVFGVNGSVLETFGGLFGYAKFLKILSDGKILMTGYGFPTGDAAYSLFKLNENGSPDTSFGDGTGMVSYDLGFPNDYILNTFFQPDGKVLMGGCSTTNSSVPTEFILLRVNPDGSYDNSFSGDGIITGYGNINYNGIEYCFDVKMQSDGKIVALAHPKHTFDNQNVLNYNTFFIIRYQADQSSDTQTPVSASASLAVQPNPISGEETVISFDMPAIGEVEMVLYNSHGQPVQTLLSKITKNAGSHKEILHVNPALPAGVYFVEIKTANGSQTARLVKN